MTNGWNIGNLCNFILQLLVVYVKYLFVLSSTQALHLGQILHIFDRLLSFQNQVVFVAERN